MHRHYLGAAQKLELLPAEERANQATVIKTFFVNDKPNQNDWQVTWDAIRKSSHRLPGTPMVVKPNLRHPSFATQGRYHVGTVIDYRLEEQAKAVSVFAAISDEETAGRIEDGELEYVSPAVVPYGEHGLEHAGGLDILHEFVPIHHAIVGVPAYGEAEAVMSHVCRGDGMACMKSLKTLTAAAREAAGSDECVSRKIRIIKGERPGISDDQAAAIAYSMCRRGTAERDAGVLEASLRRTLSEMRQARHGMAFALHGGREGRWIRARGRDVFVARNQDVDEAVRSQCGCPRGSAA